MNYSVKESPLVDLIEKNGEFTMYVEIPGVEGENVDLDIRGDIFTISGEVTRRVREFFGGKESTKSYRRVFNLKKNIKSGAITAAMSDGVLTLTLPKREQIKPWKVKVSRSSA